MIVYEFKIQGKVEQYRSIDEAIRIFQFIRNKTIRFWMDNRGVKLSEFSKQSAILAKEFDFANQLNSQARQAATERASFSVQRFYDNCKSGKPGKKGYPKFQKRNRSVEYKTSGWKLSEDRKYITFTDKCGIGRLKLRGTRDLHYYQVEQIKRVRIVRRSDGYYAQLVVQSERNIDIKPSGKAVGLDVGLAAFYTDSEGNKVENPRHLRKSEKALKRLHRRVSRKKKGSNNRLKAIKRLGRKHLKVSRQRQDFAVKTALCVVKSHDFVAFEKLQICNMVRNRHLAKSISDAAWSQFTDWLEYLGKVYGKVVVGVPPQYTSQNCSGCGDIVKKSLSIRTHICQCGCVLDRDHNAAINILEKALKQTGYQLTNTVGHTGINASGEKILCPDLATSLGKIAGVNEESPRLQAGECQLVRILANNLQA